MCFHIEFRFPHRRAAHACLPLGGSGTSRDTAF
jgi:hypothetical protein